MNKCRTVFVTGSKRQIMVRKRHEAVAIMAGGGRTVIANCGSGAVK